MVLFLFFKYNIHAMDFQSDDPPPMWLHAVKSNLRISDIIFSCSLIIILCYIVRPGMINIGIGCVYIAFEIVINHTINFFLFSL